jgi:RNA recognition motif-containing protein
VPENDTKNNCSIKTLVDSSSKRKYEESPTGREPHTKIMKNYPMETDEELLSDMIILGLSWKAKDEDIYEYFSRFGELDYYEVKHISFVAVGKLSKRPVVIKTSNDHI